MGSTINRSEQTALTPLRRKTYSRPVGNKAARRGLAAPPRLERQLRERIVPPQDDDEEIWGDPIFLAVSGVEGGRKEAGRKAGTGKEGRKEGSNFVTAAAAWFDFQQAGYST